MELNFDIQDIISIVKDVSLIMTSEEFSVYRKNGYSDIVTSCDIKVQDALCSALSTLAPASGFLCEENDINNRGTTDMLWIIDPIDGTTNFARGISNCCISVALKVDGEVRMGVVYNPYMDELYYAEKGRGAFLNGVKLNVSERIFADGILCTAMSVYNKQYAKVCSDIIYEAYCHCNDVRRFGTCALELCYLAAGRCDLYFEYRVQPWDYAAAFLILTEAGGCLTDGNDGHLQCDSPTMLVGANNRVNHGELLGIVQKYVK